MKARAPARALSKAHGQVFLAIARSERLAAIVGLIGALCVSSSTYAESQRVWSRVISSEPANSIDRARGFVLFSVDQRELNLVGTWSYTNGAVGNEAPSRVVIEGTKTPDGSFWPDVRLEVRKGPTGNWKRIATSPSHGERATVTIEPNAINFDLMVNLDAFKPLLDKYKFGRIALNAARTSEFDLKDLSPPEQQEQSRDESTERRQIMLTSGAESLALANFEEKGRIQQRQKRGNDYFLLYSWKIGRGEYDYALIPIDRGRAFIADFKPAHSGVGGSSRLKALVAKLPSRSLIIWEEASDVGLELPPPRNIDDVVSFARTKNIRVELNPILYE